MPPTPTPILHRWNNHRLFSLPPLLFLPLPSVLAYISSPPTSCCFYPLFPCSKKGMQSGRAGRSAEGRKREKRGTILYFSTAAQAGKVAEPGRMVEHCRTRIKGVRKLGGSHGSSTHSPFILPLHAEAGLGRS
eukprot:2794329-Rhodomonas_salina.3